MICNNAMANFSYTVKPLIKDPLIKGQPPIKDTILNPFIIAVV